MDHVIWNCGLSNTRHNSHTRGQRYFPRCYCLVSCDWPLLHYHTSPLGNYIFWISAYKNNKILRLSRTKYQLKYTLEKAKPDSTENDLLLKNLQFLSNHNKTLLKWGTHVYLIFTKFHNNWIKIVDFFIKGHFRSSPV